MAKKTTLFLIVCLLIVSACAFVSCAGEPGNSHSGGSGGSGSGGGSTVEAVVNTKGTMGATNLILNGDGQNEEPDTMVDGDEVDVKLLPGIGVDGTNAYKVSQSGKWGQIIIDMTRFYGRGKSYLIKATVKLDPATTNTYTKLGFSFDVVSGAVMEAVGTHPEWDPSWKDYYDCDDVYGYPLLSDTEAEDIFGLVTTPVQAANDLSTDEFRTFCAIIPAEEIEACLLATTEKYGSSSDTPTLALMHMGVFVGSGDNGGTQDGYTFILDDFGVYDLNTEIKRTGATYKPKVDEGDAL